MPRKSRLSERTIIQLLEHFIAGTPARSSAVLYKVSRSTATMWYHKFRILITEQLHNSQAVFAGEVEIDESYFGGEKKGTRGRGAKGKTIVFGLYKQNGYVHTVIVRGTIYIVAQN